jgi:PPOX class probable F420-dependent enzyme
VVFSGGNKMEIVLHQIDLLSDEQRAFAFLATVMEDGTPQVTPVWFNTDGKSIFVNSAAGRIKDKNMRARPQVALAIMNPENPYRFIQIRGRVDEITEEGADKHFADLGFKYTGNPQYQGGSPGEIRVKYKITPDRITKMD